MHEEGAVGSCGILPVSRSLLSRCPFRLVLLPASSLCGAKFCTRSSDYSLLPCSLWPRVTPDYKLIPDRCLFP